MGLFSGIGGFELALGRLGHDCVGVSDIDHGSTKVLSSRFPDVPIHGDVETIRSINGADILTAGFPCQDLSQAGAKRGIRGTRSRLVDHVFRLIDGARKKPEWVILENVSYMLKLKQGRGMQHVLESAERLGYNWAYRVIDARCFGLPQRRERVVILLSRTHNPAEVLFPMGRVEPSVNDRVGDVDPLCLYGFYWTEGKRGLGWVKDAVPTIKGGSTLGIPSPPAIWNPSSGKFGTPSISDAERMFGFPSGWTQPAGEAAGRQGGRWKLVGNTICVPMVDWVGCQMQSPKGLGADSRRISKADRLPLAAFGIAGQRHAVDVSSWVMPAPPTRLGEFLSEETKPLSVRAAAGFLRRARESTAIRFADGFLESLERFIEQARKAEASPSPTRRLKAATEPASA